MVTLENDVLSRQKFEFYAIENAFEEAYEIELSVVLMFTHIC